MRNKLKKKFMAITLRGTHDFVQKFELCKVRAKKLKPHIDFYESEGKLKHKTVLGDLEP